jgi:hypothetical protein
MSRRSVDHAYANWRIGDVNPHGLCAWVVVGMGLTSLYVVSIFLRTEHNVKRRMPLLSRAKI